MISLADFSAPKEEVKQGDPDDFGDQQSYVSNIGMPKMPTRKQKRGQAE
jgi:hypothetical protein